MEETSMNIKIADRLVELRKKNGLSQEQLADKLGLSRQAVSKWERAEASPDTDNLICLAKLYHVSLDKLLSTDETIEDIAKETREKEEEKETDKKTNTIINDDGIYIRDDDGSTVSITSDGIILEDGEDHLHIHNHGIFKWDDDDDDDDDSPEEKKKKIVSGALWGISILGITLAYILIGLFLDKGWSLYWSLFFFAPVIPSIYDSILKKSFCIFLYPLLATGVYCFIGTMLGLWHPYWFIFLTIPVYYAVFAPIDKLIHKRKSH